MEALKKLFNQACTAQRSLDNAKGKTASVGTQLLQLAQQAEDVTAFLEECAALEDAHKNSKKKDTTIPRCWTQAKSNIKAAMKFQLNLTAYETESQMRKAVNDTRKELKQQNAAAQLDTLDVMLARIKDSFSSSDKEHRDAAAAALEQAVVGMLAEQAVSRKRGSATEPTLKAVNA